MATFLELQNRVKTRLIDLPSAVLAEVPQLVNDAIRSLQEVHSFKVMETLLTTITVVANGHALVATRPAQFKEWRDVPYRLNFETGEPKEVYWAERNGVLPYMNTTDVGPPQFVVEIEPNDTGNPPIEVWPVPDANSDYSDGEYRIYLPYYRYATALASSADSNWYTVNAEQYIIRKATALGFWLDWDEQHATAWEALAKEKERDAVNADKRYRLSNVTTFVPHYEGVNTPKLRW